jgi:hypothetical protein
MAPPEIIILFPDVGSVARPVPQRISFSTVIFESISFFFMENVYKIISRFFLLAWGSEKSSSQS